jgi:hypothetical protein
MVTVWWIATDQMYQKLSSFHWSTIINDPHGSMNYDRPLQQLPPRPQINETLSHPLYCPDLSPNDEN